MVVTDDLPWIYGAARAAARSERAACDATERAIRQALAGEDRRALAAHAVRLAIADEPAAPFDALEPADAEALALVRLVGLRVGEVAALTGDEPATVTRRLTAALRTLSRPRLVA
jgi:DNA-directed RNA polymerase specialized sigma24 family protein